MPIGESTVAAAGSYLWTNKFTVAADGNIEYKPAGITMDWSTVTAVSGADVTLPDGQVVPIGTKYLRYGTVVFRHTDGTYRVAIDTTTLVRGECGILMETITDADDESPNFGGVIVGGTVYKDRLIMGGASQPTFAGITAALPNVTYLVG